MSGMGFQTNRFGRPQIGPQFNQPSPMSQPQTGQGFFVPNQGLARNMGLLGHSNPWRQLGNANYNLPAQALQQQAQSQQYADIQRQLQQQQAQMQQMNYQLNPQSDPNYQQPVAYT